ncbi:MAG: hypothetical protein IJT83_16115, partial [Victivallales bacterium]|nr:hypothetical protein [Victivallales bacterium]
MPEKTIIANAAIFASDAEALKHVSGTAYSGGPISQWWSEHPIYLSLEGLAIRPQIPLLYDHTNSPNFRLGVVNASIQGNALAIEGGIDPDAPQAQVIIASGVKIPWQLSIGSTCEEFKELKAGETETVNGVEVAGPAVLVIRATLHEVSIVAVGADAQTHLDIAASLSLTKTPPQTGATPMPENTPQATPDQIQTAINADRERAANVRSICAKYPEILAKATAENWDENRARQEVLAHLESTMSNTAPQVITSKQPAVNTAILQAAAMQSMGCPEDSITAVASQQALEAADKLYHGHLGLQDLLIEAALANGAQLRTHSLNNGNWTDVVEAAIHASGTTTVSLGGLLGGIINRELLDGYNAIDSTWKEIARVRPCKDFREMVSYRLVSEGGFQKVAPNGELQHGALSETEFRNKADTYGKLVGLTRQDIINDDLGALKDLPNQLGIDAALTLNEVFWREFMDNSGFFKNDNKNLLS